MHKARKLDEKYEEKNMKNEQKKIWTISVWRWTRATRNDETNVIKTYY